MHSIKQTPRNQCAITAPNFQIVDVVTSLQRVLHWPCVKPWVFDSSEAPQSKTSENFFVLLKQNKQLFKK